ncbi:MAG: hypothetical protein Q7R94_01495 [bacterium]|nr:hypothetical protein [bacterium]
MLSKKLVFILIAVVAFLVVLVIFVGSWAFGLLNQDPAGPSAYSAVYLATGDIYFGKLSWFPRPHLKNVWFLQRTAGPDGQTQLGLAPFGSAFWGPVDEVYLNPKQIILWTRLRNDSQVAKAFMNPQSLQPPLPAAGSGQASPPGADFQGPTGPPPSDN